MSWLEESCTYQDILKKGMEEGRRRCLLRIGRKRFGEPSEATLTRITAIIDSSHWEQLLDRYWEVTTWEELLADE